ncbi:MAG: bifunctional oligoribonuclease/PAP phosphatase NrnA [Candidatus Omnitrophota bacterium]
MRGLKQAADTILAAKEIVIGCHINPDGDAIGSLLSLGTGLEGLGKRVHMVSQDGVPKKYRHLPGADRIMKSFTKNVDLAITVDCSTPDMLGTVLNSFKKAKTILEIDHHETREPFGDTSWVDPKAAAVGEQVYILLKHLKIKITRDIAQNILTALIVETSSFRLPNVRPFTFNVCAELVKTGVDFYKLVDTIFWSHPREVAVLSGICLARCQFLERGKLAWSVIRKKDFEKTRGKDEDVDGVADEIRAIKGVKVAVFFREKSKELLRVSLRSKGDINVAHLAAIYGGGGHADVAGCRIPNKTKAIKKLLGRAKKLL